MTVSEDEAVELTLHYINEIEVIASQVGIVVRDVFIDLVRTDRADIEAFIREAAPWAKAGSDEGADLAAAYLSELTGAPLTASDIAVPEIPWDDPFLRTWHNLSEGMEYDLAKERGGGVAEMIGRDATRDGAASRMAKPGTAVRGWRRVISAHACEWCRVVGTKLYKTQETATFGHHGCKCEIVAVPYGFDPGGAINEARLRELKASGAVERVTASTMRRRAGTGGR